MVVSITSVLSFGIWHFYFNRCIANSQINSDFSYPTLYRFDIFCCKIINHYMQGHNMILNNLKSADFF